MFFVSINEANIIILEEYLVPLSWSVDSPTRREHSSFLDNHCFVFNETMIVMSVLFWA